MFDSWSHGKERTGNIIAVGEVVLGNHRSRLLVIHVRKRIHLLELTQRFDAVVRNDEDIGVVVHVFQDCAQDLVESDVLVREGICAQTV